MGWHGLGERELNIALLTERNALYKQDPLSERLHEGNIERGDRLRRKSTIKLPKTTFLDPNPRMSTKQHNLANTNNFFNLHSKIKQPITVNLLG